MEFKSGNWNNNQIDVRDFIQRNYTPYDGDESFLVGKTEKTKKVLDKFEKLLRAERENGGVLNVDTTTITSILTFQPGYIDKDNEVIVGLQTDEPLKRGVNPFGGMRMARTAAESYGYKLSEDLEKYFKYKTTHNDGVFSAYTDEMKLVRHAGLLTGLPDAYGRGRIIGDYRRLPLYGMDFLINKKEQYRKKLGKLEMTESNIRALEELSKQISFMEQLKIYASWYGFDISQPAQNATEAVQWLYFAYLGAVKEQNGAAMSLGRVSAFLDIYIEQDIRNGVLTEETAQELIDQFVIKLRAVRHLRTPEYNELFAGDPNWVTISEAGVGVFGQHMVTKTSYRFLNTLYNLGASPEPNITILWSEKLPENYKRFCAKVSIDTDSIQYENDDLMRKLYGDDYAIACCVSAMTLGKQMQFFGARCNMPKTLLLSLNNGYDEIEQIPIVTDLQDKSYIMTYEDKPLDFTWVWSNFLVYMRWMAHLYVNTMNVIHYMHDKYAYERLQMSFHDEAIHRFMAFGMSGISVVADSLSAIKYAKVYPIKNEKDIIVDFKIVGDFPKFGNDDDRVDNIAKTVASYFIKFLKEVPAYRDAEHTLSLLTITSNVVYGKKTGATPDGRKKGEPFAPGANPMHGRDTSGALASLNSVAKLNYNDCRDGISNTFTVTPQSLGITQDDRVSNLVSILDGYFEKGGHHINVNVLNRDTLIDAMEHPEKYPTLTIRVSGYAVRFHKLSKEQQLEVIKRTFHNSL